MFFFSSRRRHTRCLSDWSSDVCSSDLYTLPVNNGENSLHGGTRGFDKYVWTPMELSDGGLQLTILSKDGDQGYPGNLNVTVAYHLTNANEVRIDYTATTDKD